ncbi:hypothetical protein GCHA_0074 [Paraglaciecola chathamensis S18K6]|uniref:Uncharacterized protein n=1 Tax=Paraglaciecola chathamensis S18K6 TaxID=1127672 RepID=A0AAV3USY9_9ALTE|nr:hypothetical protein GCHA_0074 [Paraglaciecola chathamensis S18K6]
MHLLSLFITFYSARYVGTWGNVLCFVLGWNSWVLCHA